MQKPINLILFFSRGISLQTWDQVGMLEREVALYKRLLERGVRITFITYGDSRDKLYKDQLGGIKILCNSLGLSPQTYESRLHWLFAPQLIRADIIKTNQFSGADVALRSALRWKKPLIVRGGYVLSSHIERMHGRSSKQTADTIQMERNVLPKASQIVVTASFMAEKLQKDYQLPEEKFTIIPNYVNTDLFQSGAGSEKKPRSLCFIGRFIHQKNPLNMLEALDGLNTEISLIGSGALEKDMRNLIDRLNLKANFIANIPNYSLPHILNQAEIYIQPSIYEGHPKSIIEAMSCGLPVIGANTIGTREVIQHGKTGLLCEPTVEGIREAVRTLLEDETLRRSLGENARQFVLEHYALNRIASKEYRLYEEIVA